MRKRKGICMRNESYFEELKKSIAQRNFFIFSSMILLIANLLLSILLFSQKQLTVLVPYLKEEAQVYSSGASSSYLQEMTHMFIAQLLNLNSYDIQQKKASVLSYTSSMHWQEVNKYFEDLQEDVEKYKLATFFTLTDMKIKGLEVEFEGILISKFGKEGEEKAKVKYQMSYTITGGVLRLKRFKEVENEKI